MTGGDEGESKERKRTECAGCPEGQEQKQECDRRGLVHGELDGGLQTMVPFEGALKSDVRFIKSTLATVCRMR